MSFRLRALEHSSDIGIQINRGYRAIFHVEQSSSAKLASRQYKFYIKVLDVRGALRDKLRVITFQKAYVCSDTNVYATLELAQEHELVTLLKAEAGTTESLPFSTAGSILVGNKQKVIDILSISNKGRPRGRARNTIQRLGGIARAKALTSSERVEIAKHAAKTRWESDPSCPREPAKESAKAPETAKAV